MSEGDSDCSVGTVRALIQDLVAQSKDEVPVPGEHKTTSDVVFDMMFLSIIVFITTGSFVCVF